MSTPVDPRSDAEVSDGGAGHGGTTHLPPVDADSAGRVDRRPQVHVRHGGPDLAATPSDRSDGDHVNSPGQDRDVDRRGPEDPERRAQPTVVGAPDRQTVVAREKGRFGGMKFGSSFFGWLTATGLAVLLLVILFVAYYCGGYVAGRMARFDGVKQGLGVWLWAIITSAVIAAVAAIAGAKYNVLAQLNLPRIPVDEGSGTTVGVIAIGAAIVVALLGALLGGAVGTRYHRKVDAVAFDDVKK